jgi:hypothetical protein
MGELVGRFIFMSAYDDAAENTPRPLLPVDVQFQPVI